MTRTLVLLIFMAGAFQAQSPESKQAQADRIFGAFNTQTPGAPSGSNIKGSRGAEVRLRYGRP